MVSESVAGPSRRTTEAPVELSREIWLVPVHLEDSLLTEQVKVSLTKGIVNFGDNTIDRFGRVVAIIEVDWIEETNSKKSWDCDEFNTIDWRCVDVSFEEMIVELVTN